MFLYPISRYARRFILSKEENGDYTYIERWILAETFNDIEELRRYYYHINNEVFRYNTTMHFIDNSGEIFSYYQVSSLFRKVKKNTRNYKFRNGPVPLRKNRYKGKNYRNFSTFPEISLNDNFKNLKKDIQQEYGINIKGRKRKLPSTWDDIAITNNRSWKKYRKTQYK